MPIESKRLGETEVRIPEIGIGTSHYSGGLAPIRRAVELGAVLVDTAELYGTEEIVGAAIRDCRGQVFLATKARPRNFRRKELLEAADRSLAKLGVETIDLYQLHWPNTAVPLAETMAAMEGLVEAGKVRFIGVSNFSVRQLRKAQAALSRCRIASNQVHYSLVERTVEYSGLMEWCRANRVTVIGYSPLLGVPGLSGSEVTRPHDSGARGSALRAMREVARKYGRTEAQVALKWCVRHPHLVTIPKSDHLERVEENCAASGWQLEAEDIDRLNREIPFQRRGKLRRLARNLRFMIYQRLGRRL